MAAECEFLPRLCTPCPDGYKGCHCGTASDSSDFSSDVGVWLTSVLAVLAVIAVSVLMLFRSKNLRSAYVLVSNHEDSKAPDQSGRSVLATVMDQAAEWTKKHPFWLLAGVWLGTLLYWARLELAVSENDYATKQYAAADNRKGTVLLVFLLAFVRSALAAPVGWLLAMLLNILDLALLTMLMIATAIPVYQVHDTSAAPFWYAFLVVLALFVLLRLIYAVCRPEIKSLWSSSATMLFLLLAAHALWLTALVRITCE